MAGPRVPTLLSSWQLRMETLELPLVFCVLWASASAVWSSLTAPSPWSLPTEPRAPGTAVLGFLQHRGRALPLQLSSSIRPPCSSLPAPQAKQYATAFPLSLPSLKNKLINLPRAMKTLSSWPLDLCGRSSSWRLKEFRVFFEKAL